MIKGVMSLIRALRNAILPKAYLKPELSRSPAKRATMTSSEIRTERRVIENADAQKWLLAYEQANETMEKAGFPRFRGTPVGHLLDVPGVSAAASRFAGDIRQRESAAQRRSVDVQYTVHLTGGKIVAEASYARRIA